MNPTPTRPPTLDAVLAAEALAGLARLDGPRAVADRIRDVGVRGRPCCGRSCIIARYVAAITGVGILVSEDDWCLRPTLAGVASMSELIDAYPLPPVVRAALLQFDCGLMPDLVDTGAAA